MKPKAITIILAAGLATVAGCSTGEGESAKILCGGDCAIPGTWEYLGKGQLAAERFADERHLDAIDRAVAKVGYEAPPSQTTTTLAKPSFIAFNVKTRDEYRVVVTEDEMEEFLSGVDLDQLRAGSPGMGVEDTGEGEDIDPNRPVSKGWSNAHDSREKKSTTHNPSRKTVFFSNSCSGALIGPRHVLTAAHCVVSQGTNNWKVFTVKPGGNESPYASIGVQWYYTPPQFRQAGQSQTYYNRYDYAMIILNGAPGNTVGWMGHAAWSAGTLNQKTLWNRGYPRCPNANGNAPQGCNTMGQIWGDTKSCKLGSYLNPEPDGWNANIMNSCDISGGQSGSPVYYYNGNIPVAIGVQFWENCYTCGVNDDYPNRMRRLTPSALDWISLWKAIWP